MGLWWSLRAALYTLAAPVLAYVAVHDGVPAKPVLVEVAALCTSPRSRSCCRRRRPAAARSLPAG